MRYPGKLDHTARTRFPLVTVVGSESCVVLWTYLVSHADYVEFAVQCAPSLRKKENLCFLVRHRHLYHDLLRLQKIQTLRIIRTMLIIHLNVVTSTSAGLQLANFLTLKGLMLCHLISSSTHLSPAAMSPQLCSSHLRPPVSR